MIAFLCGSSGIYFPYYVTKIGYVYKACLEGFHMEIKRFMKFLPLEENNVIRKHAYDDVSPVLLNASTLSDNTDTTVAQKRIDTSQCGKTLGCLRVPSGCNDNTDCKFLLTFAKKATYIEFSVSGKSNGWVAVGFNDEPKMGGTDAVICQPRGRNIALSVANLEYDRPDLKNANETKLVEGRFEGGIVYCKFTRRLQATSNQRLSIDISRYIIYGKGSGSSTLNKHEHGDKGCSKRKVDFDKNILYDLDDCEGGRIEKVHASFMIFAWMFLVLISIFIARYSRSLWKEWKIFGCDAWFQFHRLIMDLAVLMTIIAIIMIFVDKEGWSESAGDHAIFGIIVLVLAIIQPTIAFFRPHPNTPRRSIFNWFHRIVALLLVIFVVVAVFQGAELLEDSGGDTVRKVLIALIVIAIITALVLECLAFRLEKKRPLETNSTTEELQEVKQDGSEPFWETKIQRILLMFFALVVFILAVVMIVRVAGAGSDNHDHDNHDDD